MPPMGNLAVTASVAFFGANPYVRRAVESPRLGRRDGADRQGVTRAAGGGDVGQQVGRRPGGTVHRLDPKTNTVAAAITTGSMAACGIDPCAPRPNIRICKLSAAEVMIPDRPPIVPAGPTITC